MTPWAAASALRAARRNPLDLLPPDVFSRARVDLKLLGQAIAVVNDPETIRDIQGRQARCFALTDLQKRLLRPAIREGLVLAEGRRWSGARRQSMQLTSAVSEQADAGIRQRMDTLGEQFRQPGGPGCEDRLQHLMGASMDLLAICLFDHGDLVATPERQARMQAHKMLLEQTDWYDLLGLPEQIRSARVRRMERLCHADDAAIVAAARDSQGLLGQFAGEMNDRALRDFVVSLLSGHESVGLTAYWTLAMLAQDPATLAAVRAVPEPAFGKVRLSSGNALERTIAEALRLYPTFPFLFRKAKADCPTAFGSIGRGTTVIISPYIMHRHTRHWQDAARFRADRHRGAPNPAYMPFGIGQRRCIGMQLGLYLSALMVHRVLRQGTPVITAPGGVEPKLGLTLRPRDPAALRLG